MEELSGPYKLSQDIRRAITSVENYAEQETDAVRAVLLNQLATLLGMAAMVAQSLDLSGSNGSAEMIAAEPLATVHPLPTREQPHMDR